MKSSAILGCLIFALSWAGYTQNVFNPDDPIVRYNQSRPLGHAQHPNPDVPGLQKWVSTPTNGVSIGNDTFDVSSFKQYFINVDGAKMAFRLKFPRSYRNPDSANKKYPINLFLHGGGEVGCSTNGGIYNNERQLWLGGKLFRERVDKNEFDGFLLYPQMVITDGCFFGWGSAPAADYLAILAMVDSMARYIRADIDRLLVTGLSGGGYGAWRMASGYPRRVAKIIPSAAAGSTTNREAFVHIPIWFATGGLDPDPSPAQAEYALNRMKEIGANIRYTPFPERGHSVWYQHWREPEFVAEMNDVHKANPLVFFQRNEFCRPEEVNAKIGLTSGFYAYEWQMDGQTIATSVNGQHTVINPNPVISFTGNEITVREYGTYRARFKRWGDSPWSDWSPKPAVIGPKGQTATLPIEINGARSKVLPALDGSTTVPLKLAEGFVNYEWFDASSNEQVATTRIFEAPVGVYKGRYAEEYGCGTSFSPNFPVIDAEGSPKPDAATNLQTVPASETSVRLNWSQGSGETGFEVYRGVNASGPYVFVALTAQNATTFLDTGLLNNTTYFYRVRAVNETGAAAASNEATAKTLTDDQPPTAPSNLRYTESSASTAVRLNWNASTDNNGVIRYDIYVNGVKLYSTTATAYTVTQLDSLIPYNFIVKAVDAAENVSPPSNQTTYIPEGASAGPVPGIPDSLAATGIAYNMIRLTWQDTTTNETGFEIVRSATQNGTYVPIGTAPADAVSYTDSGLAANKRYFYRIRAIGNSGQSDFTDWTDAVTLAAPATPVAPTQLEAREATNGTVSLTWKDNSGNETGFEIYRSTDNETFTVIDTVPANSNAYTDTAVTGLTTYYYYVAGFNNSGTGAPSNTAHINAGNNPPVIGPIDDIFVKTGASFQTTFTVGDDPGDHVTLQGAGLPHFVKLAYIDSTHYRITVTPAAEDIGRYEFTVIATDDNGKSTAKTVVVTVSEQNVRSVYLNLGSPGRTAAAPWNNWLGTRNAGDLINDLKDENNQASDFVVTTVDAWSAVTLLGHLSGNNSGAAPDSVLASGLADGAASKQIRFSGLNPDKQYNLVFISSQNEGINALAEFKTGSQASRLNARYNTGRTANLNNLLPDANGEVLVTISKLENSPLIYLNGIIIEEYDRSVQMTGPANLYAETVNQTSIRLTWSDRTNNESAENGYELQQATDSLFTQNLTTVNLPANTTSVNRTNLTPNTRYWFRVRARNGSNYTSYTRRVKATTPEAIVYVNFNVAVADAPAPWNNLAASPMANFTTSPLTDQAGRTTSMTLTLEREFNGEFNGGVNTQNNSGIVPDNVLRANYWLDKNQLGQFRVSGLNHSKRYRIGFIGSSDDVDWFKGNYTATYAIDNRKVYLNSWKNSTKIVYIDDVSPDANGKVMLNFSTTPDADYGFNAGVIIEEFSYTPDTSAYNPIDTIINDPGPIDTIPGNPGPNPGDPTDTLPDTPDPVDSLDTNNKMVKAYPNPFTSQVNISLQNTTPEANIALEVYDPQGRLTHRKVYGRLPEGQTTLVVDAFGVNARTGVYIITLKQDAKIIKSVRVVKNRR